ncbi:MAG: 3'-5' exonuclease [Gammaproteobacteria bacterium SHHR-1]|uniref:3'-5' exonuclease n=1 Tax=Magnetovirga frankeli TaxID=947516 RepID=UPI0012940419|nr:3'-5' exonuclease [gamma proteobacterium SS-5]
MLYLKPKSEAPQAPEGQAVSQPPDWPERLAELAEQARHPALQAYYRAGCVAADTPLEAAPLLAMDFETTGMDPAKDDIVSIGLLPMSLRRIRCAEASHWLIRPRGRLHEDSVVIHRITHSALHRAPDLLEILEPLLEQMQGRIGVVHHRGMERAFLDAALRQRIGEGISFPLIDTMELEARLHRNKPLGLWQRLRGQRPVSIRLGQSRARYHLPFYRPHHALTDALACAELLQAQVAHRFSANTPLHELWC